VVRKGQKNNNLQNTTHKKDGSTQTTQAIECELRDSGEVSCPYSASGTCRFTLVTNPTIRHE
jgi:hypothetical protein